MKTILGGQEDRPPLALRYQWRRECKTKKDGDTRVSMEPPPLTLIRRQGGCLFMNNTDVYPGGLGTLRDKRGAEAAGVSLHLQHCIPSSSPPPGFHTLNAFNHFTCSIYVWTDPWTQDLLMWGEFWIERNVARAEMAIWEIREDLFLKMGPNYKLIIGVLLRNRVRLTRYTWMGFVELFQVSEVATHFVRCYLEQNKDILVFAEMWNEVECLIQRLSPFGKKGYSVPGQNMP